MAEKIITLASRVRARPGREQEVRDALTGLVEPSRSEPGCINYELHQDPDDASSFMFYENWASQGAFESHLETPYIRAFLARADDLLAAPVEMKRWVVAGDLSWTVQRTAGR